jgi:polyhydroxyalkanoate synthase
MGEDSKSDAGSTSFADLAQAAVKVMQLAAGQAGSDAPAGSNIALDPQRYAQLQSEYFQRLQELAAPQAQMPEPSDRRFSDQSWKNGAFASTALLYELNAKFMNDVASSLTGDPKEVQRVQFATSQMVDAMSPSNFLATNPQAQEAARDSSGASLQAGMQNFLQDIMKGNISQSDETAFELGVSLAVTPGSVVYENELIQLIQYAPTTKHIGKTPMLMVPPCINKFYILDLQPENSVVKWLVGQGHTVFMISWRNVQEEQGHFTWDDYLDTGVISAIQAVRDICGVKRVNALGFCVGGTILATALAALAARDQFPVRSLTLLTSLLDFEDSGVLNIFIDEDQVSQREKAIGEGGILPGAELAATFSSLRPNDLVWNYVSRNYLQGERPPAFDLLFWNADSTNLPGPFFAWYLRHMYLQNDLREPGQLTCIGESIDVSKLGVPTFVYGSREDHIVPWKAAFNSCDLLGAGNEFVLGASGHIAGVINPPAKQKRHYWTNDLDETNSAEDWFDSASQQAGSWWPHWAQWLSKHSGKKIAARSQLGSKKYPEIEPAPGRYVKQRA